MTAKIKKFKAVLEPLDDGLVPVRLSAGALYRRWSFLPGFYRGRSCKLRYRNAELGPLPPIIAFQQRVAFRNQLAQPHALVP